MYLMRISVLVFVLFLLGIFELNAKDKEDEKQYNCLEINMLDLAPYALWNNYYGIIKLGRNQSIVNCVYIDSKNSTLIMGTQHSKGDVRGKYEFLIPADAEKIEFKTELAAPFKKNKRASISVGYIYDGEIRYPIDKSGNKSISLDLEKLSGKRSKLFLKANGTSIHGSFVCWKSPKIIAFYRENGLPDLAVSPSDLKIKSLPCGNVIISAKIQNIASHDAKRFDVKLFINEKWIEESAFNSMLGKSEKELVWNKIPKGIKGDCKIKVQIDSNEKENSKGNNKAELVLELPSYQTILKNIELFPSPWNAEKLIFNLDRSGIEDSDKYKLVIETFDYFNEKVETKTFPISKNKCLVEINLSDNYRIGWWKVIAKIICDEKEIDNLSASFCKPPKEEYKSRQESIFHSMSDFFEEEDIDLFKTSNASYLRFSIWKKDRDKPRIDKLLKKGIIPYCILWPKTAEEASALGRELASQYPHKSTRIWWEIWAESNSKISPQNYAVLLKAFYEGAHSVDPEVKVASMEMTHCQPSLMDDGTKGSRYEWLEQLYPQIKGYFHAVGNNHYSHLEPEKPFYDSIVKPIIDVIKKNGDFGKVQIHLQEGNVDGGGSGAQAAILVRTYLYQLGMKEEGASIVDWFCMRDYWTPVTFSRNGMVRYNRNPKPSYQAYCVMTSLLKGAEFLGKKNIGEDNYCYFFKDGDNEFACLWKGKNKYEKITVSSDSNVELINIMGNMRTVEPENGKLNLMISSDPIYIKGLRCSKFKLLSRENVSQERNQENFEKEYKEAADLLKKKNNKNRIYYNIAKHYYQQGVSNNKIQAIIKEAFTQRKKSEAPNADKKIKAFYSESPIKIDGNISEWKNFPIYKAPKDLFIFQTAWDKKNIYFAFQVKDKNIISKYRSQGIRGYGGDCVELYLDVLNKKSTVPGIEFFQLYFGLNKNIGRYNAIGKIRARMKWKPCKDGYAMEIAFPLDYLFLNDVDPGCCISFNASIDDSNKAGIIDEFKFWKKNNFRSHTSCGADEIILVKKEPSQKGQGLPPFYCSASKNAFLIKNNEVVTSSDNLLEHSMIRMEGISDILFYYRNMNVPMKKNYITGKALLNSKIIQNTDAIKEIKAFYSIDKTHLLELNLLMKKEYPVVWCEAKFKNTSDMPMNIGIEWQLSNRFERYLSVDKNIYDMPRKIVGMEMTQHLMSKENWQSIGITPFDKWIYFLPKSGADGLGVFMITRKDETSFWGVRQDLLPYWGEKRKILEENGFLSSKFILIPAKSEKEFIDVLDRIKERR